MKTNIEHGLIFNSGFLVRNGLCPCVKVARDVASGSVRAKRRTGSGAGFACKTSTSVSLKLGLYGASGNGSAFLRINCTIVTDRFRAGKVFGNKCVVIKLAAVLG